MQEKRTKKRLELTVSAKLVDIVLDKNVQPKDLEIEVCDISCKGIGFKSKSLLSMNDFYNAKITIWTKEVIDAIISIVRISEINGEYFYGGIFVGMSSLDSRKFDIYEMFHESE